MRGARRAHPVARMAERTGCGTHRARRRRAGRLATTALLVLLAGCAAARPDARDADAAAGAESAALEAEAAALEAEAAALEASTSAAQTGARGR